MISTSKCSNLLGGRHTCAPMRMHTPGSAARSGLFLLYTIVMPSDLSFFNHSVIVAKNPPGTREKNGHTDDVKRWISKHNGASLLLKLNHLLLSLSALPIARTLPYHIQTFLTGELSSASANCINDRRGKEERETDMHGEGGEGICFLISQRVRDGLRIAN